MHNRIAILVLALDLFQRQHSASIQTALGPHWDELPTLSAYLESDPQNFKLGLFYHSLCDAVQIKVHESITHDKQSNVAFLLFSRIGSWIVLIVCLFNIIRSTIQRSLHQN